LFTCRTRLGWRTFFARDRAQICIMCRAFRRPSCQYITLASGTGFEKLLVLHPALLKLGWT
jgi:hypothetical protein